MKSKWRLAVTLGLGFVTARTSLRCLTRQTPSARVGKGGGREGEMGIYAAKGVIRPVVFTQYFVKLSFNLDHKHRYLYFNTLKSRDVEY